MKRKSLLLALMLFGATAFNSAFAQQTADIPQLISYQGLITATDGKALPDGRYQLVVTLYADENGTTPIWNDAYSTALNNGVFDLYLGSNTPLPSADAMNRPLWVGVKVNGAEEMRPLTRLTSSPYAMNVPDKSITTSKLATGAVTADKVSMNYVAGITINGEKLAGNGTVLNITSGKDVQLNYDKNNNTLAIEMTGSSSSRRDDDKNSSELLVGEYNPSPPANGNVIGPVLPANYSTISGGQNNRIVTNTDHGTIAGGNANTIQENADQSTISGGANNLIDTNTVNSTIGGGSTNYINKNLSCVTIAGGCNNTVNAPSSTIGGGINNRIDAPEATIGGGNNNVINVAANNGTISGGINNRVDGPEGTVGGGNNNAVNVAANDGTVGGGLNNFVDAPEGTIGGGRTNLIGAPANNGTVGGGSDNHIHAIWGTIAGGMINHIGPPANWGTVGGGIGNHIHAPWSTISGGNNNHIAPPGDNASIGGGQGNFIDVPGSRIGGGSFNIISGGPIYDNATIGGGLQNQIVPGGFRATIPGGDHLLAQSWAQTVVGAYNIPSPVVPVPANYGGGVPTMFDGPIFIVGNGWDNAGVVTQSHAFEVSYSGHSTVFDINGPGAFAGAKRGGTYVDNVIYAWGNVNGAGMIVCDFGVATVTRLGVGWYRIRMNIIDRVGNPVNLLCGSVTATINSGAGPGAPPNICNFITASQIGPGNMFDIYITRMAAGCVPADANFNFKVTGR